MMSGDRKIFTVVGVLLALGLCFTAYRGCSYQTENASLTDQMKKITGERDQLQKDKTKLTSDLADANKRVASCTRDSEATNEALTHCGEEKGSLETRVATLTDELAKCQKLKGKGVGGKKAPPPSKPKDSGAKGAKSHPPAPPAAKKDECPPAPTPAPPEPKKDQCPPAEGTMRSEHFQVVRGTVGGFNGQIVTNAVPEAPSAPPTPSPTAHVVAQDECQKSGNGCPESTALWILAVPFVDGDEAVIPTLPDGAVLVNVSIYDGTLRNIGAKHRFALKKGEGFNFQWKGRDGIVHWMMITPRALVGAGLIADCSHPCGCKYFRQ